MANWIHNIEIKNFKSIRHARVEDCRRVNVFIGYPNVGKSNILEALGLLTFIRQTRPIGLKGLVRYEKFTQIFHNFNINDPAIIEFNSEYSLIADYENERALGFTLKDKKKKESLYSSLKQKSALMVGTETMHSSQTNDIDDFSGRITSLKGLNVKPYKFSPEKNFSKSFSALELEVPIGENMFEVIANNRGIKEQFSELLRPFGLKLLINVSENDITITQEIDGQIIYAVPISLVADTLIRLIFFKTAIYSNRDSVLLFEEPEAHMFPPYISKFTSDVIYDKNDNQFFIATHSPFVMNDFMEDLEKEDLAIYAVGYKKETGETVIRRITDDEINEIYQYGIDLFFNLESFLKDAV